MISFQKRTKIQCSYCQSVNIRPSKWASHGERNSHPGSLPFRCLDCSKRFFGDKNASRSSRKTLILIGAILSATLFSGVAIFLFLTAEHSAKKHPQADPSELLHSGKGFASIVKAAETGDAKAQLELGQTLMKESGGAADKTAVAVRWLTSSATNGNADAMVALGRLSKKGMGVLQSYDETLKWTQAAAKQGNADGMLELGRLYRDGVAVERDPVQAYIWMNRAAAMQNLTAAKERDLVARALPADKLKEAQSLSSNEAQIKPQ
jgi:TPR repeat protein